jgi:hypothetical protein
MERPPLVEDIQNYAQNIVDTVREPLLILDTTLRVRPGPEGRVIVGERFAGALALRGGLPYGIVRPLGRDRAPNT